MIEFDKDDHLGEAIDHRDKAREAVKSGNYDLAWGEYQKILEGYAQHINRTNERASEGRPIFVKNQHGETVQAGVFEPERAMALLSSVNEELANIRRLEKKHDDALVHFIYFISGHRGRWLTKGAVKKLQAYRNRAGLKHVEVEVRWSRQIGQ